MGYHRSMWRGLAGGGGGVAVVRCSCSEEEVKISFRSVGEDRRLRRVFVRRWFGESLPNVVFFIRIIKLDTFISFLSFYELSHFTNLKFFKLLNSHINILSKYFYRVSGVFGFMKVYKTTAGVVSFSDLSLLTAAEVKGHL